MREIAPQKDGEPIIRIYESQEELKASTLQKFTHGFYDPRLNLIVATTDSLAHEIGHFRDFKSGKMRIPHLLTDPTDRIQARMRNEIVAILFAYTKCGEGGTSLKHELSFIHWLEFSQQNEKAFLFSDTLIQDLQFQQIQELSDWVCLTTHPWFERLQFIFRPYLQDELSVLTYGSSHSR